MWSHASHSGATCGLPRAMGQHVREAGAVARTLSHKKHAANTKYPSGGYAYRTLQPCHALHPRPRTNLLTVPLLLLLLPLLTSPVLPPECACTRSARPPMAVAPIWSQLTAAIGSLPHPAALALASAPASRTELPTHHSQASVSSSNSPTQAHARRPPPTSGTQSRQPPASRHARGPGVLRHVYAPPPFSTHLLAPCPLHHG